MKKDAVKNCPIIPGKWDGGVGEVGMGTGGGK